MKSDQQLREEIANNRKLLRERKRKKLGLPKARKGLGCRVSDRDEAAKVRLGYTNPGSYVRRDGSEVLKGEDWKWRKVELYERTNGACERESKLGKAHAAGCDGYGNEPHHIKRRSNIKEGRDDRLSNLANLNHFCHLAEDPRKPRFSRRDR